jgi:hypothetical protein
MLVRAKFFATGNEIVADSSSPATSKQEPGRLTIFIPEDAIFNEQFVWVVSTENKAELRTLTLGTEIKTDHRQVLDGVKSGEQVVLPPFNDIEDGTRIRIKTSNLN